MGRIRSRFIKSSAKKIYEMGCDEFTDDYNNNKKIVSKYAKIPSKKLNNVITGAITHTVRMEMDDRDNDEDEGEEE